MYETGSAITSTGALTAFSGAKTGRSPLDKRIVKEATSENEVWWGPVNRPMSPEVSGGSSLSYSNAFVVCHMEVSCGKLFMAFYGGMSCGMACKSYLGPAKR